MSHGDNSALAPPRYPPSLPPKYTSDPADEEETLQAAVRSFTLSTGMSIKTDGQISLVLNNQIEGAIVPSFGRLAHINGTVAIEAHDRESVRETSVTHEGQIFVTVSGSAGCHH
ncbi:hypothetical protein FISHEDRAFT_75374 [Fistulina hepatica ATCC 64428]|uniref:Uncharacterized protein n=1 Tax=Fistulina hepatica ATCC 64428 TaxID=1128425 RepID=A0A0D7A7E0_9AGAR|nr:hypothetical protein FISHEDRAFT_75374 [Fistulina hepatica ATCC 64428]